MQTVTAQLSRGALRKGGRLDEHLADAGVPVVELVFDLAAEQVELQLPDDADADAAVALVERWQGDPRPQPAAPANPGRAAAVERVRAATTLPQLRAAVVELVEQL